MARCRTRSGRTSWICFFKSPNILKGNVLEGSAGGTRENVGCDRQRSLAERGGKEPSGNRKKKKRKREEIPNEKNQPIFLQISGVPPQDQKDDKEFQAVVVESALELRGDEAPKAEPPFFFGRRDGKVHFGRHAGSPKRTD